jgi:hypothetical protein
MPHLRMFRALILLIVSLTFVLKIWLLLVVKRKLGLRMALGRFLVFLEHVVVQVVPVSLLMLQDLTFLIGLRAEPLEPLLPDLL